MKTTVDRVARGALLLEQPADGYRHNADAVILARFARDAVGDEPPARVVDLGAGCGVVGLLLARALPRARVTLLELQPELAELCRRNAERNDLAARVDARCEDLRAGTWRAALAADAAPALVVCNPPFFRVGEGRLSPKPFVARARHELSLSLAELIDAVAPALDAHARLAMIYPTTREDELRRRLAARGLVVRRRRAVCAYPGAQASRVLLLIARGRGVDGDECEELEPLCERDLDGRLDAEREGL